jgi:hypothetical protein
MVIKRIVCCAAVAAVILTCLAVAGDKATFTADRHKALNIGCAACHGEEKPKSAASEKACLTCHKSLEAVAEKTMDYNKNPHKNHLTEASDLECTQCHYGHKADIPVCNSCHQGIKFEKQRAEAK